jgi:hypothetical protein
MRDGIVDKGVYVRYCNDIILLADWAAVNQLDCFTPFGLEKYSELKCCCKMRPSLASKKNESRMDGYIEKFTQCCGL